MSPQSDAVKRPHSQVKPISRLCQRRQLELNCYLAQGCSGSRDIIWKAWWGGSHVRDCAESWKQPRPGESAHQGKRLLAPVVSLSPYSQNQPLAWWMRLLHLSGFYSCLWPSRFLPKSFIHLSTQPSQWREVHQRGQMQTLQQAEPFLDPPFQL